MSEGYLITNCSADNLLQVELLVKSIKYFDKERPVSIVTHEPGLVEKLSYIDKEVVLTTDPEIVTANYFHSLLNSPYEKTIAFLPDQLLTNFNPEVWENLRGMNGIVLPKHRYNFNGEVLPQSLYHHGSIEEKSFNDSTVLNAVFFNKSKGCDYVFGLAVVIASQYDQNDFIDFFGEIPDNAMPTLPEYLWPEWLMTLLSKILSIKVTKFDFVECIDLTTRENSYNNENWARRSWPEFLSYWVNQQGSIKIENYVQLGLIKYTTNAWLTETTLANLRKKYT
jgi:hypothetical protein